ncbi:MAG: SGNH/GDSL hydrolase family protein [Polyangiaceae bacterium]
MSLRSPINHESLFVLTLAVLLGACSSDDASTPEARGGSSSSGDSGIHRGAGGNRTSNPNDMSASGGTWQVKGTNQSSRSSASTTVGGAAKSASSTSASTTGGALSAGGTASGGSVAMGGSGAGGTASGGSVAMGGSSSGGPANGGTGTDTPRWRIVGRTSPGSTSSAIRFSWPGVYVNARFTGTRASMILSDGSNKNRFTIVVDGGAPKTATTIPGQTTLPLAAGLTDGSHDIAIWRNTEASMGVTQFTALSDFGPSGGLLAPPSAPSRRIEVIGDSLTVGAGNEGTSSCPGGIDAFTNNYLAYGSVAARSVNADVVTIAWSGIGVYRNYDGSTTDAMPSRYPYAIPNDASAWDFTRYQPHVVVFNLGTNDFGAGDPGTAYETAYVSFIKTVRTKYPNAHFILIDMYGGTRLTRINNVVGALKAGGDSRVETLSLSSVQNNLGCNQHPNVAAHAAMGNVLATRLKALMGW